MLIAESIFSLLHIGIFDDCQIYSGCLEEYCPDMAQAMEACNNRLDECLKLNPFKTDLMWFSSLQNQNSLEPYDLYLKNANIPTSKHLHNLSENL